MEKNEILEKLFSGDRQLPTLPVIFDKLNTMLKNPHTSNKKIADLIIKDQAMVIKILKLCNSAMYSKRQKISNLANAITFLGVHNLKTLILKISLVKTFSFKDDGIPQFSITTFWEHSLATAYFTNIISKKLNLPANENYYIAGLLHDIGKLVVYQFYPDKFAKIIKLQVDGGMAGLQAEETILGVNHNDIGGYLAEKWNFDPEIIAAIRTHHDTSESQSLFVAIVQLSNMFSKTAGLCFPWDGQLFEIVGDANWQVIARHRKGGDIDELVVEIMEESGSVRDSVKELLGSN
ncbi:MAG: HDOD domain-containing protein [bacterium]|nr:HDOD domain-containing protein [bacterium]